MLFFSSIQMSYIFEMKQKQIEIEIKCFIRIQSAMPLRKMDGVYASSVANCRVMTLAPIFSSLVSFFVLRIYMLITGHSHPCVQSCTRLLRSRARVIPVCHAFAHFGAVAAATARHRLQLCSSWSRSVGNKEIHANIDCLILHLSLFCDDVEATFCHHLVDWQP